MQKNFVTFWHHNYFYLGAPIMIIEQIIKKTCVKPVFAYLFSFHLPSFFRREEKRGKNNQFVIHLFIQQIITVPITFQPTIVCQNQLICSISQANNNIKSFVYLPFLYRKFLLQFCYFFCYRNFQSFKMILFSCILFIMKWNVIKIYSKQE